MTHEEVETGPEKGSLPLGRGVNQKLAQIGAWFFIEFRSLVRRMKKFTESGLKIRIGAVSKSLWVPALLPFVKKLQTAQTQRPC